MRVLVVILAIAALAAVAFYAAQRLPANIEADIKRRATESLAQAKLPFANVSVKGRVLKLSGEAPNQTAKAQAAKIASDVWGVASVQDELTVDVAAAEVNAPQPVVGATASDDQQAAATAAPPTQDQPASPAPAPLNTSPLPSVAGLVDPALAPPAEPPASEPASQESPTPPVAEQQPSPPPAAPSEAPAPPPPPAESASAPAAATPAPQDTRTALLDQPSPVAPPAAIPPETPAAPIVVEKPPAAAPAPVAPPPSLAPPPAVIAQGARAGLTASVQLAPTPEPPTYRLEAHIDGKRVELQGLVSTRSAERALLAQVRRHVRRAQVAETLDIANGKADADWLRVARTGLAQLAHLEAGSLRLDGRSVSMSGRPKRDKDRDAILAAMNNLPAGFTSSVMLERTAEPPAPAPAPTPPRAAPPRAPPPAIAAAVPAPPSPAARRAAAPRRAYAAPRRRAPRYRTTRYERPAYRASLSTDCRRRFGDVLPRVAVEFESGSSHLRASAGLDEFARIARTCPVARIRLIGHSDTHEAPVHSQRLSRERALAVREALEERGIAGSNISIAGRGGTRPAFSNTTADGRGNNRRVEFAVW